MSGQVNLGSKVQRLRSSPHFKKYSKVIIVLDDDGNTVEAGDDTGRTLELSCPWGTAAMAQNILNNLADFEYRPYEATGAMLDPSVELGDAVNIQGVYGGVFKQDLVFSHIATSGISAPQDEEVDHEFPYKPSSERRYTRQLSAIRADLIIKAGEIEARVVKEGGSNESFGWSLQLDNWSVYSNGNRVFKIDRTGAEVMGAIKAQTGYIGGEGGFTIQAGKMYIDKQSLYYNPASQSQVAFTEAYERAQVATNTNSYTYYIANGSAANNRRGRPKQIYLQEIPEDATSVTVTLSKNAFRVADKYKSQFVLFDANYKCITFSESRWQTENNTTTTTLPTGTYKYFAILYGVVSTDLTVDLSEIDHSANSIVFNTSATNYVTLMGKRNSTYGSGGVYVGIDGISLGKDSFVVTREGALKATSVDVSGKITATSGTIGGCSIVEGVLKIKSANILSIDASTITAGTLNVDRIEAGSIKTAKLEDGSVTTAKLGNLAVTEGKLGGAAVTTGKLGDLSVTTAKIGNSAVSYGKTGFQGTLDQVGQNKADIASLWSYVNAQGTYINNLSGSITTSNLGVTNSFYFGSYYAQWKNIKDGDGNTQKVMCVIPTN